MTGISTNDFDRRSRSLTSWIIGNLNDRSGVSLDFDAEVNEEIIATLAERISCDYAEARSQALKEAEEAVKIGYIKGNTDPVIEEAISQGWLAHENTALIAIRSLQAHE